MAKDLFLRLCNVNVQSRYSAEMALKHPWITRRFSSPIPITIYEEDTLNQLNIELRNIVRAVFFGAGSLRVLPHTTVGQKAVSHASRDPPGTQTQGLGQASARAEGQQHPVVRCVEL